MARATSRKREEQGVLPEGQTKQPRVEIDKELKPSNREPEGTREGKLADAIIVLPSADHRPSGGDELHKQSLGSLQQTERRRHSPSDAESRLDQADSEVPTKLYAESERRCEISRSPTRESRGSSRRSRESEGQRRTLTRKSAQQTARVVSHRTLLVRHSDDTDTNVSTVFPADSASALSRLIFNVLGTVATREKLD
eukprot:547539-Amphidinium_carterae.1